MSNQIACIDAKTYKIDHKLKGPESSSNSFTDISLILNSKKEYKLIALLGQDNMIIIFNFTTFLFEYEMKLCNIKSNINSMLVWNEKLMIYNLDNIIQFADYTIKEIIKSKEEKNESINYDSGNICKFDKFYVPNIGELLFVTYEDGKIEVLA